MQQVQLTQSFLNYRVSYFEREQFDWTNSGGNREHFKSSLVLGTAKPNHGNHPNCFWIVNLVGNTGACFHIALEHRKSASVYLMGPKSNAFESFFHFRQNLFFNLMNGTVPPELGELTLLENRE